MSRKFITPAVAVTTSLSLLLSSTAWAVTVPSVRVPVPVVHVNVPTVHINVPVVNSVKSTVSLKTPVLQSVGRARGNDLFVKGDTTTSRNWPVRNRGGAQTASSSGVVVTLVSNGNTESSPGVTVARGSNDPTTSPGKAVYSAGQSVAANGIGRNGPIRFGVPNEWPTPFQFESGPAQPAQALAAEQQAFATQQAAQVAANQAAQAAATALQSQVQTQLGLFYQQLGFLVTQLINDEIELLTLSNELTEAQECTAPNSQVQCPSSSVAQLQQEINILQYNIGSITWAIGTLQTFLAGVILGTWNPSQEGGYTQQTVTDLIGIVIAVGGCVEDADDGFACYQGVGAILQGIPNVNPLPPGWDPGINVVQDMGFVPPCPEPTGYDQCN
jgi:hypothetical protein